MNRSITRIFVLGTAASAALIAALALPSRSHAQTGPFQFHSLTPCRVIDTRFANQGGPTPIGGNASRAFTIKGQCGVPAGAKAVAFNVTAVSPAQSGFMTIYPSGISQPTVSTLNWAGGEGAIANGAVIPVAAEAGNDLTVFVGSGGSSHVILDVSGYFE